MQVARLMYDLHRRENKLYHVKHTTINFYWAVNVHGKIKTHAPITIYCMYKVPGLSRSPVVWYLSKLPLSKSVASWRLAIRDNGQWKHQIGYGQINSLN